MRHRKQRTKLSMMRSHRTAAVRNIVKSLFMYQSIETTLRRAKEARRLAEHLITISKAGTVAARRRVYVEFGDHDLVNKLFNEVTPLFKARTSGFTRIIPLGFRRGDGAQLALFELTEKKIVAPKKPAKKKAEAAPAPEKESTSEAPKPSAKVATATTAPEKKHPEHKKEEPKAKTISKSKQTLAEEKRAERARTEDKKIEGKKDFMKNLRGFFRRKSDM